MMLRLLPILALLALAGCKSDGNRAPAPTPPPAEQRWSIGPVIARKSYSPGMPRGLDGENGLDFPRCSDPPRPTGPSVHYVTMPAAGPLKGTMTLTFEITGTGALVATEGAAPARLRLHFQRRGDDWQAENGTEFYRWWSASFVELRPGVHTLTVPLERARWTPVLGNGRATAAHFAAALADPARVGFSFGGDYAGHGVCLTEGAARFVVLKYAIR